MLATKPKFGIGTLFTRTYGKHKVECKVVDVETTFNLAGEQVRQRYVASHEFCGQTVVERDIVEVTVAKGVPCQTPKQ